MALACAIEHQTSAHGRAVVLRLLSHVRRPSHREASESRRTNVTREISVFGIQFTSLSVFGTRLACLHSIDTEAREFFVSSVFLLYSFYVFFYFLSPPRLSAVGRHISTAPSADGRQHPRSRSPSPPRSPADGHVRHAADHDHHAATPGQLDGHTRDGTTQKKKRDMAKQPVPSAYASMVCNPFYFIFTFQSP